MSDVCERLVRFAGKVCLSTDTEVEAATEIERLRAENEKLHNQAAMNGRLLTENAELREENRLVGLQMDRMADEIEKLRAALDCFLEQSTPTQWRYSRERAERLAKGILAAAALKETGE